MHPHEKNSSATPRIGSATSRFRSRARLYGLAIATLVAPVIAFAGPWEVGSVSPAKTMKLKAEVTYKHTDSKDTWARPAIKFAGPLTPDMSYEIAGGYGVVEKDNGFERGGSRDVSAKVKWRLLHETESRPVFVVEPKVTFGSGDQAAGISDGVTTLKLPLRAAKKFGRTRLTGEAFYTHGFDHDYRDLVGYGGLLECSLSEPLVVGIDLLADRPTHDPGKYHLRSNVAFKWYATKTFEVQGLVGRSIANHRGSLATSAELVTVYKF